MKKLLLVGAGAVLALSACTSPAKSVSSGSANRPAAGASSRTTATATATATANPPAATGAAGAAPDPCSLLTSADISGAGVNAAGPTPMQVGVYHQCVYGTSLVVMDRAMNESDFKKSVQANPGTSTAVSGIGQEAYLNGDTVVAWANGVEVVVLCDGNPDAAKKLAATAAGHL